MDNAADWAVAHHIHTQTLTVLHAQVHVHLATGSHVQLARK